MADIDLKQKNSLNPELEIDLGRIIRLLLMQSKMILLIIFLGTALGIFNYIKTDKIYKIDSLLQVLSSQRGSPLTPEMDFFLGSQNTTDLNVVEELYTSRSNLLKVIGAKKINITFPPSEYAKKKLISYMSFKNLKDYQRKKLILEFNDETFGIRESDGYLLEGEYGLHIENNEVFVKIMKPEQSIPAKIEFEYQTPESKYKSFKNSINISSSLTRNSIYGFRNSGLLQISLEWNNQLEGSEILDYTNKLFLENNIESEAETARKAISFIDNRLDVVIEKLEDDKKNLNEFREQNKTINVDLEIQSIIDTLSNLEEKLYESEIELAEASISFTDTNPIYLDLIRKRDTILEQKNKIESVIKNLPISQQTYIDFVKELELSQQAYNDLLSRKLELSIKEASTLGNIRIVDDAYSNGVISPTLLMVIFYFLASTILAMTTAIFRGLYFLPITNPAELEDNRIFTPIIGVIPKTNPEEETDDAESERSKQSLESLVVNIENISKNNQGKATSILITSPTSGNGKSYVSRNLAKKISELKYKVVIIDADWKRGDQHKEFSKNKITIKEFYNAKNNISEFKINENLYFVPRISQLTDSFQLLYSDNFNELLDFLKSEFDYIIFDTAPVLSVSDTSVLMTKADLNIAISRHGLSKINEIKQMMSIGNQLGIEFDGIVYNSYERPSSYYGYYGFYGNYAYQYYAKKYLYQNYDYKKNEE